MCGVHSVTWIQAQPAPASSSLPPSTESSHTVATVVPTVAPSLLPTTTVTISGQGAPTVGQCLPQLTRGLPAMPTHTSLNAAGLQLASQPLSTVASTVPSAALAGASSMPLSALSLFSGGGVPALSASGPVQVTSSAALPGSAPGTTHQPPATAAPPLTAEAPPLQTTTVPSSITNTAHPLPQPTTTTEPIKPGVPTPLPPGVNPETLAVLCRMPDSDLQKLNLPVALLTAIRVWRGQHSSVSHRGRKVGLSVLSRLVLYYAPMVLALECRTACHHPSFAILPTLPPPSPLLSLSHSGESLGLGLGLGLGSCKNDSPLFVTPFLPQPPSLANSIQATPLSGSLNSLTTIGLREQTHVKNTVSAPTQSSLPPASLPPRTYPPSRPLTRHQLRTEQTKAERDRLDALNKVCEQINKQYAR